MLGMLFVWAFSNSETETETETDSNLRLSVVYRSRLTYVRGLWLTCNGTCFYTRLSRSLILLLPTSISLQLTNCREFVYNFTCVLCVCVCVCVCALGVGENLWKTCLAITSYLSKRNAFAPEIKGTWATAYDDNNKKALKNNYKEHFLSIERDIIRQPKKLNKKDTETWTNLSALKIKSKQQQQEQLQKSRKNKTLDKKHVLKSTCVNCRPNGSLMCHALGWIIIELHSCKIDKLTNWGLEFALYLAWRRRLSLSRRRGRVQRGGQPNQNKNLKLTNTMPATTTTTRQLTQMEHTRTHSR